MNTTKGSLRQTLIIDMLASERRFTSGEILTALKNRGINYRYLMWSLDNLRKSGSLDEVSDPTHKLRKLYKLRTTC